VLYREIRVRGKILTVRSDQGQPVGERWVMRNEFAVGRDKWLGERGNGDGVLQRGRLDRQRFISRG
jgi:hypothetical protein